jgi:hypothetical protein
LQEAEKEKRRWWMQKIAGDVVAVEERKLLNI